MAQYKSEPIQSHAKSALTEHNKTFNDELSNENPSSWKYKYHELNKVIKELLHTRPNVSHIRVRRTTCSKPIETIIVKDDELEKLERWCKDIDIKNNDTEEDSSCGKTARSSILGTSEENSSGVITYPEIDVTMVNKSKHNEIIYSFPPRRDDTKNTDQERQVYIK